VTGDAFGMGKTMAHTFEAEGATVVIADVEEGLST
jgi:NAD(P)-dependent dehydrogenase (short-subunit alcohol dehydrogenase family)